MALRAISLRALNPRRSVAGRLALIVTGAVTAALSLASCLLAWRELDRYVADKRLILRATAQVVASSSVRATVSEDGPAAEATLSGIAHDPTLIYVSIERADGTVLAEQGLGLRLGDDLDLDREQTVPFWRLATARTLKVTAPIVDNATPIGQVVLVADTNDLGARMGQVGLAAALAGLIAIAVGLAVSLRLQRSVTRPLAALARTMETVRQQHDYGQRAPVSTDDEVGALAGTFNELLGAINERDSRIAQHGARLESDIRDRTLDLEDAKRAAEAANAAKSTFLATMSHEIRTPLNGMLVMAELLATAELPPQQARYAGVIAQSGQSLLAIINDVLDFAKIEAGKIDVERIPTDPRELADTVVTLFGERARKAGLDLAARIAPDVPRRFVCDPVRLGQVLSNFVSNAIKFTPSGHVLLRMEMVDATPETKPMLRISVEDTGIGIPQDRLSEVFSAFTQADASTTRWFGGTGLGLSIAERLIVAMGGRVGVESRPDSGSTFWAQIPLEIVEAGEAPPQRMSDVGASVHLNTLGPATRKMLAAGLDRSGFRLGDAASDIWIIDAATLVAKTVRPAAARVIAVAPVGASEGVTAVRNGLADAVLRWPIAQTEWEPVLAALAQGTPPTKTASSVVDRTALPNYGRRRVLVADDSAVNREVAVEALARFGITSVACVENGAEAVETAGLERFDIILMDGSMPVLDGFAATRCIRANEAQAGDPRVPIIALTAHVIGEAATAWRDAGMDGMLAKPFTLSQLADLLAAHLGPPSSVAEGDASEPTGSAGGSESMDVLLSTQTIENLKELGSPEFLARVLRLYARQAPAAISELQDALVARDAPAVAKAAHSLKSMSANIGASELAAAAGAIERAARTGTLPEPVADTEELRELLERSLNALELRMGAAIAA